MQVRFPKTNDLFGRKGTSLMRKSTSYIVVFILNHKEYKALYKTLFTENQLLFAAT